MATPIETLEKRLPEIIQGVLKRIPVMFQGYVGVDFGDTGRKGAKFRAPRNTTNRLRIDTGRLFKSFLPNSKDNIREFTRNGTQFTVTIGTKVEYAAIHEYGGNTGRNGQTKIPARPYFRPAIEEFLQKEVPTIQANIRKAILEAIA